MKFKHFQHTPTRLAPLDFLYGNDHDRSMQDPVLWPVPCHPRQAQAVGQGCGAGRGPADAEHGLVAGTVQHRVESGHGGDSQRCQVRVLQAFGNFRPESLLDWIVYAGVVRTVTLTQPP